MWQSLVGPVLGAVMGGMGGKDQKSTQTNMPYISPNHQKGLDWLFEDVGKIRDTEYSPMPTTRAMPSNTFGGLFDNSNALELQRQSDARFAQPQAPAPTPAGPSAGAMDALQQEMLGLQSQGAREAQGHFEGRFGPSQSKIMDLMRNQGLKKFYSLNPQQQQQVLQASMAGQLKPDTFQSQYGFNPFQY